jgi:hypothetical protein
MLSDIESKIAELDSKQHDIQSRHNYTVDLTNLIHDVLNLRHKMREKLEQDYERSNKVKRMKRSTTLRDGGHTRLYELHHAKHLRKTEALKLAAQKLRGKKRSIEEEPINRSP